MLLALQSLDSGPWPTPVAALTLKAPPGPQVLKMRSPTMPFAGDANPVAPGEVRAFTIDFTAALSSGDAPSPSVAPTSSLSVYVPGGGTDPNAATLPQGFPVVTGNIVSQFVGIVGSSGFQAGVIYRWEVVLTTAMGATLIAWGHYPCVAIV